MFIETAAIFFTFATGIGAVSYTEIRDARGLSKRTLAYWIAAMTAAVGVPTLVMLG